MQVEGADRRERFEHALDALLAGFGGELGLYAEDLRTGERLARNADEQYDTASVIKLPILLEALRRVQVGQLDLAARHRLTPEHYSEGSGVLKDLQPGLELTVRDVCVLMVTVSDNVATNMLIDLLGMAAINATAAALGAQRTVLRRRVSLDPSQGPLGLTTPSDCVLLLKRLDRGEILDTERREVAFDILLRQQYNEFLSRYLPYEQRLARRDPEHNLAIYSKSGWTQGQRNDVGIVAAPGLRYAVALFARGLPGPTRHPDHPAVLTLQRASKLVYDHFAETADLDRAAP